MAQLFRGDIWYINFPNTFDPRYPNGKWKFVVVLQEGDYFKNYDTVTVLLTTKDSASKGYETNVTIPRGTTQLREETYIICAQPYTIKRELFDAPGARYFGHLDPQKMAEVDAALYNGLCMGQVFAKDLAK
ncbi:MAG: type II toxin-antitoxin system PemK/MazF family toxin [Alicyclobacillus macrosporangiidus]|uniref:type II toxin-antitoxin system PemK/MazF family toxin n=1 Tax=Alicyclobacillus macrosporangiidus TaxID=392015 RepID=UPI0026EAE47C|nr:type II toxin-antitoxin system PemK/MazF family toxin [Alicyclobacillus macrosporangiidus]MCL6599522.1 type II toxin-antitoxin system PemK/MazF family toxin [Alicyclobacillus macrosporangiidus]